MRQSEHVAPVQSRLWQCLATRSNTGRYGTVANSHEAFNCTLAMVFNPAYLAAVQCRMARRLSPKSASNGSAVCCGVARSVGDTRRPGKSRTIRSFGPNTAACGGSTASGPSAGGDCAWTNLARSISSPNMAAAGREGRSGWSGCGRGRCLGRSRHQHGGEPRARYCRLGHPFVARV